MSPNPSAETGRRGGCLFTFENLKIALIHVHELGDEDRLAQQLDQRDHLIPTDPVDPGTCGAWAQIFAGALELTAHHRADAEDAESLLMFHRITDECRDWLINFVKSWDAMVTLRGSTQLGVRLKFGTAMDTESGTYVPAYFVDNGHCIVTNPRLSEDGRFQVDPTAAYDLTAAEADLLLALNAARGVL